jgi:hypothetical protein
VKPRFQAFAFKLNFCTATRWQKGELEKIRANDDGTPGSGEEKEDTEGGGGGGGGGFSFFNVS